MVGRACGKKRVSPLEMVGFAIGLWLGVLEAAIPDI